MSLDQLVSEASCLSSPWSGREARMAEASSRPRAARMLVWTEELLRLTCLGQTGKQECGKSTPLESIDGLQTTCQALFQGMECLEGMSSGMESSYWTSGGGAVPGELRPTGGQLELSKAGGPSRNLVSAFIFSGPRNRTA